MLTISGRKGFKKIYLVHSTNPRALSDQLQKGLNLKLCAVGNVGRKYPIEFADARKFPSDRPLWLLHVEEQAFIYAPQDENNTVNINAFQDDKGPVSFKDLETVKQSIESFWVTGWSKGKKERLSIKMGENNITFLSRLTLLQMAQIQSAVGMVEVRSIDLQFVGIDALGATLSLYGMIHYFDSEGPQVHELHLCTNIEAGIIHYPLMPHEFGRTKFGASREILPTFFELDL